MKARKNPQTGLQRGILAAALLLILFSVLTFSVQYIYSNDLSLQVTKSYGIYQNGVYQDTKDTEVPSPFVVQRTLLYLVNSGNSTRNITIYLAYSGNLAEASPYPAINGTSYVQWNFLIGPSESKTFYLIGKDLETGIPTLSASGTPRPEPQLSNKNLSLNDSQQSSPSNYSTNQTVPDMYVQKQKNLDFLSEIALLVLAGMLLLLTLSGFMLIFGKRGKTGPKTGARIKIAESTPYDVLSERVP